MLEARAAEHGAKAAVLFPEDGTELSYTALKDRVGALAAALAGRGLRPGDAVALVLGNGRAMVEMFLAVPSASLVCVPLNPHAGAAQLRYMLGHSGARLVVCEPAYREHLDEALAGLDAPPAVLQVDGAAGVALDSPPGDVRPPLPGTDAVIDYTSGTTGHPKGVVVDHRILGANARTHIEGHALDARDRALLALPLHHMNAQGVTLLSSLEAGASVVVPREFTPESFWRQVADYRCTWFALVPSLVAALVRWAEARPGFVPEAGRIRFARSSSAPLPAEMQEAFEERFAVPLIECMGMTEAGPVFFNELPPATGRRGSVGRPVGCEVRVVGEDGAELRAGREGRIQVRGPCVMRRYHDDPQATAKVLDADGWLTGGDNGLRDEAGFFFIRGREADRVNKSGEKVSLREVEEALNSFPGVAEAAAAVVSDPVFGQDVAGFVVAAAGSTVDTRALRRHCEGRLGQFLAPTYLYIVDSLPRGAVGKVLRRELAEEAERRRRGRAPVPVIQAQEGESEPRFLAERVVADLWKDALGVERIGIHDDFFDLGGNSQKAIRLCYRVKEVFDIDFPVSELFQASTVAAMAALIDRAPGEAGAANGGEQRPALITLLDDGEREPAYLIPAGTGDEDIIFFLYGKLARYLRAERPVLAFRAPGLDGRGAPPGRIEALAQAYIEEMRRRQPAGPYYLVGFCIGGLLAFEIARRLRAEGDEVGVLMLVDTAFPGFDRVLLNRLRRVRKVVNRNLRFLTRGLWGRLRVHASRLRELGVRDAPRYLLAKLRLAGRLYDHATLPAMRLHPDRKVARRIGRGQVAYQRNLLAYRAKPYDGPIQVFVSEGERELRGERWHTVARGGMQLHQVPGDHYTHCREFAEDLAAHIGAGLSSGG